MSKGRWKQPKPQYRPIQNSPIRKYGISVRQAHAVIMAQGYACAICGWRPFIPKIRNGRKSEILFLDHKHSTNQMRSWLCFACNSGLGMFRDNIEFLKAAIEYLERQPIKGELRRGYKQKEHRRRYRTHPFLLERFMPNFRKCKG